MYTMTADELGPLFLRFKNLHIGVLGDFALDCYWSVDPSAAVPSLETGKLTCPVRRQCYSPGAAGNVAMDLAALGCAQVSVFGVTGVDPWGTVLRQTLEAQNINIAALLEQRDDWATVAYVKPHVDGEEQRRTDFGDFNRLLDSTADHLLACLAAAGPQLDALVINAQARAGVHNRRMRDRLADIIGSHPDRIFVVDSRDPAATYAGCILKINDREAVGYCGIENAAGGRIPRAQVLEAAHKLFTESHRPVFVTRGSEGILVVDESGVTEIAGMESDGEIDTTGAGDAALAGITAAVAAGAAPRIAACVGNLAGAVSIRKRHQTGTAAPEEMLSLLLA